MIANAGNLMKFNQDNLPASSITVFIMGFIIEKTQNNNKFKRIKIITNEFIGKGDTGRKFFIKCRYLRSDERIDKKIIKIRKNLSIMITGKLILINSEFQVDIQDLNFLLMSMTSIESTTTSDSTSSYSWSALISLGRLSAQVMTNTNTHENSTPNIKLINTDNNNDSNEVSNEVNDEIDNENITNLLPNTQKYVYKRKRIKK